MSTFKLSFTETMTAHHEIIVETDLTENELLDQFENIKFRDAAIA